MRKILILCLSLLALTKASSQIYTFGPNNPNAASVSVTNVAYATNAGYAETAGDASFATDANLAVNAVGSSFATNALTFNISNALHLGTTYPTIVTSDSAGLVIDQPLTVGGTTPGVTFGNGGPSITSSGKVLNIGTNIVFGTNSAAFHYGGSNTLVLTGGKIGIGKANPSYSIDSTDTGYFGGLISSAYVEASAAYYFAISGRGRIYSTGTTNLVFRDKTGTNGASLFALDATLTNTLTASNLIVGTTYPTTITSDSTGLVTDQPLTVGGATPSVTLGSGGPSITASGSTVSIRTNFFVATNNITVAGFRFGMDPASPTYSAMWSANAPSATTNYCLEANPTGTETYLNASSSGGTLYFLINNSTRMRVGNTFLSVPVALSALSGTITNTLTASNIFSGPITLTNSVAPPVPAANIVTLWNSNGVLFGVSSTKTNVISDLR